VRIIELLAIIRGKYQTAIQTNKLNILWHGIEYLISLMLTRAVLITVFCTRTFYRLLEYRGNRQVSQKLALLHLEQAYFTKVNESVALQCILGTSG